MSVSRMTARQIIPKQIHLTHLGGNEYSKHRDEGNSCHENDSKTEQNVHDLCEVG